MPLLFFATLLLTLLMGFPVAFTLGGVAVLFAIINGQLDVLLAMPMRIYGIFGEENSTMLMAVPLFIYMGMMLEKSGLAEELLETMALLFGRLRGGLAISVVIVGGLLAASTGIVGATVVTMGLLSLPTMMRRGYSPAVASGTICASGTLGQIIPPSIVLVLLGTVLNVDVGAMFMAAVIPGVLLVVLYLLWIVIVAYIHPEHAPAMPADEIASFTGLLMLKKLTCAFLPPLLLMTIVLGSIFAGIASPTEAAAVGAAGATVLTVLQRKFNYPRLAAVMKETTLLTSMVFLILVGATAFSLVFRLVLDGDSYLLGVIDDANLGPKQFLIAVMLVIFIAGFFIDFIEIIFIVVPVIAPVLSAMGIDLLWVGILIAINLQTSFLTPPFGFSLFYLKGVAPPEVTTNHIYRGILPYIVIQLIALLIVALIPESALWLPSKLSAGSS